MNRRNVSSLLFSTTLALYGGSLGALPDSPSVPDRTTAGRLAQASSAWTPPIGIPRPDFGIEETHMMYQGQTYDYNGAPSPYKDAGYGPYTHFVDNTHPAATDTSNPYGTADKPRTTFPASANIQPGAVIEMHGGPYDGRFWFTSSGTAAQPIFVRGPSTGPRPIVYSEMTIRARYVIVENIDFDRNQGTVGAVIIRPYTADEDVHHVSVRNCEVHDFYRLDCSSTAMMTAVSYLEGTSVHDIVFYANHIHPDDDVIEPPGAYEKDTAGVGMGLRSNRVWVVDNHIHNCAGDGVGAGHGANYTVQNYYIGRNVIHDNAENAVDLKEVENVILSQNVMYSFYGGSGGSGGDGTAIVIHYGPTYSAKNVWVMFNEISSTNGTGVQVGGDQRYDVYLIGNIVHNIHNASGNATGFRTWNCEKVYFLGNVFYDVDNGISWETTTSSSQLILHDSIVSNVGAGGFHLSVDDSSQFAAAQISYDILHQPGASATVRWGSYTYDVAQFQASTGKCEGCLEADPLFVDPANNDFALQPGSPAIDAGIAHSVYQLYQDLFGMDIRVDYSGVPRPQGSAWDIGAYELVPLIRTLSVAKAGTGQGSVASSPPGIDCGSTCSASFEQGSSVTLTAAPATGSQFTGWSGACSGTSACVVAMTADRSVTATFEWPTVSMDRDVSVAEGDAGATGAAFSISMSRTSAATVTVQYATVDGTASAGSDYTATSGTATFSPGTTTQTISVPVLGDVSDEPNERFYLNLASPGNATILDGQGVGTILDDDGGGIEIAELSHGFERMTDLAGPSADEDLYVLLQNPHSSYEVVVDATSGDLGEGAGPALDLVTPDGTTVVQSSLALGRGPSRSLRVENATAFVVELGYVRVRSASCATDCSPDDVYQLRAYETTCAIPRFNNSGTQITVLVLQNPTDVAIAGRAYFRSPSGALLAAREFTLSARQTLVLNTSTVAGVSGASGTITVSHNGRYGGLAGKAVALEPATGFSFDTPMAPRAR